MGIDEVEIVELELKYCECCGGLWLRLLGTAEAYCPSCVPKMAEFARARVRGVAFRSTVNEGLDIEGCEEFLAGCGEGGHA